MKKAFFLFVISGLFIISCKKDSPVPAVDTKTKLIARTWQMQTASITVTSSGLALPVYTKGGTANLSDFSKYQLSLNSDGKFTLFDGAQNQTGTWQLLNNDTQMDWTNADNTKTTYKVNTASATNLDLEYQVLTTTQNPTEKGYLAQAQALGFDVSKGLTISTKLIPQ
jgi:hypothetical protein